MVFTRLLNRPVTILKRVESGLDSYNNPVYTFNEVETVARIQPVSGVEILQDSNGLRDTVVEYLEVFFDIKDDVTSYDKIKIDGITHEIFGNTNQYAGFDGNYVFTVVRLRKNYA